MKKKHDLNAGVSPGRPKVLSYLKLFTFLVLFTTFSGFAYPQVRVTLNMRNATLGEVFRELGSKTGYDFAYSSTMLEGTGRVNVEANNQDLTQVLTDCLRGKGLEFRIEDRMVMISARRGGEIQAPQSRGVTVSGIVKDVHGNPMAGVAVILKGTTKGIATDQAGRYTLSFSEDESRTLEFRLLGHKSKEVQIASGKVQQQFDVVMEEETLAVSDVVVTGIFAKARESYTGAARTITAQELSRAGNRSVLSAIANIDPSFNIVSNLAIGSNPNTMPEITVRGNSSFGVDLRDVQSEADSRYKENMPLFILDGFEISLERFNDLDVNIIETVTLLKDASSTAMYGTRGANGVVVITTKRPEAGKLRVTYKGGLNLEVPDLSSYDLMNAREKLEYEFAAGLYSVYNSDGTLNAVQTMLLRQVYNQRSIDVGRGVDTYWLKYPIRTGVGQSHSVSLEGGNEEFRYMGSLGYKDIAGAMKGSDRKTTNGNILISYHKKNFSFQNDLHIGLVRANESPYGMFSDYAKMNSYYSPYDDQGNVIKMLDNETYFSLGDAAYRTNNASNPLWNASLPFKDKYGSTTITNNFSVEWYLLPELFVRGRFGITKRKNSKDLYKSAEHTDFDEYTGDDFGRRGTYLMETGNAVKMETDVVLSYQKTFNDKHQLYAGLSWNVSDEKNTGYTFEAEGISNPANDFMGMATQYAKDKGPLGTDDRSRRVGGTANVNYTYDYRYFVDIVGQIEGSSKFGSSNRTAPFWSAGMGWNIHRESFLENIKPVNTARLRLSYGTSGSQNFNPYQALRTFKDYGSTNYSYWNGVYMMALGNPDLGWQTTDQLNVGMDLDLFDYRIRLTVDAYNKVTNDLLQDITIPTSSGFNSYKANIGKVQNRGFEINLSANVVRDRQRDIYWTVNAALIHNKNTIKKISNTLDFLNQTLLDENSLNPSFLFQEGQSINTIFVVPSLGIDPANGQEIFLKKDGTQTYEYDATDKMPYGTTDPKFWGNFSTLFRYKKVSLNAVFSYRWGGQYYNKTLVTRVENLYPYDNADRRAYTDRWTTPGVAAKYKKISDLTETKASSRFVMDLREIQCKLISVSYELDFPWLRERGIQYFTIAAETEDLFTISSIKQERGWDYPFSRKFSLNLTFRF